jgi:4-methyl-5(b-hydroxyethyl)-thiazole monophosphate biosynthesis
LAKACVFLTDGTEETEAIVTVDLLRRAGIETETVSLTGFETVTLSHGVRVIADRLFGDVSGADALIMPGGPGSSSYRRHAGLIKAVSAHFNAGKLTAAICAAPTAIYDMGLLAGRTFTCYPGCGDGLAGRSDEDLIVDKNLITAKGPGKTAVFALAIISALLNEAAAEKVGGKFIV